MKPNFSIIQHIPRYGSRDEITGYRGYLVAVAETRGWAEHEAGLLQEENEHDADLAGHSAWIEIRNNNPAPVVVDEDEDEVDYLEVPF